MNRCACKLWAVLFTFAPAVKPNPRLGALCCSSVLSLVHCPQEFSVSLTEFQPLPPNARICLLFLFLSIEEANAEPLCLPTLERTEAGFFQSSFLCQKVGLKSYPISFPRIWAHCGPFPPNSWPQNLQLQRNEDCTSQSSSLAQRGGSLRLGGWAETCKALTTGGHNCSSHTAGLRQVTTGKGVTEESSTGGWSHSGQENHILPSLSSVGHHRCQATAPGWMGNDCWCWCVVTRQQEQDKKSCSSIRARNRSPCAI